MEVSDKKKYALGFLIKGKTSVIFVDTFLSKCKDFLDETSLRSIYILLSYGFEMILKSRIILSYEGGCEKCLNRKLINLSHDLEKVAKKLGSEGLSEIGIEKVELREETYINSSEKFRCYYIKTIDNKNIRIENFIDVRYPGLNLPVRPISKEEFNNIKECIKDIYAVIKNIEQKQ